MAALDLVALATVADVVPLIGLNRAFVVKGLAVMRRAPPARASRLCSTSPAPTGRRDPIIWASSSARASMRADASATRRSARGS